mgnify:CR=1 FL=1
MREKITALLFAPLGVLANGKKSRRLGMLTIFKRALSQVKTWLRVFLWREGLTLTVIEYLK